MILLMIGPLFAISSNGFIPLLVLFPLILFASVVAHEVGHAVAATLSGMTVLQLRAGPIQCAIRRHGARIRWNGYLEMKRARLGGFVFAIPDPARSLRRQQACYAMGGPLANLAVAMLAALIGYALLPRPIAFMGFAVAWLNLMMAIGNLVPIKRAIGSDGKQLLEYLKAKECKLSPYQRLVALSIRGTRPDEMPVEVIEAVGAMPAPLSLFALYVRLAAHQNSANWTAASALEGDIERLVSGMPKAVVNASSDLLAIIRTELAFSKAMCDRDRGHLSDDLLPRATAWLVPYLRPRCLALDEALAGNDHARDRQLDLAMRHAKRSVERSVARSEALLCEYIRAI